MASNTLQISGIALNALGTSVGGWSPDAFNVGVTANMIGLNWIFETDSTHPGMVKVTLSGSITATLAPGAGRFYYNCYIPNSMLPSWARGPIAPSNGDSGSCAAARFPLYADNHSPFTFDVAGSTSFGSTGAMLFRIDGYVDAGLTVNAQPVKVTLYYPKA